MILSLISQHRMIHHFNMEKSVQIAKSVLAKMFKIDVIHFDKHISRYANINEARRFLIYYLIKELGVKYLHIKHHVPALTNHATAIHHFKKMEQLMDVEWITKQRYDEFISKMDTEGHIHLMKDYTDAIKEMQLIKSRLKTLKEMIE